MVLHEFLSAAFEGDLPRVQRMLADGDVNVTDAEHGGRTALLQAAMDSNSLQTVIWLLQEGGARITDRDSDGFSALLLAAAYSEVATCHWLLEHGGADITDRTISGRDVWDFLELRKATVFMYDAADITALLRVMVLKGAPSAAVAALLHPEHAQVVEEGARLRAALPAYLAQRRALLDAHCPLIAPLRDLVRGYDPEPTTTEELWATVLGAAPQRARRLRVEAVVALPVRRSDRLRQRLE
jgi:hypothetical protein